MKRKLTGEQLAIVALAEMHAKDPINYAAEHLPPGWEIRIDVERGFGGVTLTEGGESQVFEDEETWQDNVLAAVNHAKETHELTD
jgi:hypothetical protein